MSMKAAVKPASLWAHFTFRVVKAPDKTVTGRWVTEIPELNGDGIWGESELWFRVF